MNTSGIAGSALVLTRHWILLLAMVSGTSRAEWPQWRGPDRNGVAPGDAALAGTWPAAGPVRLWMSEPVPKDSLGSPVVADGRVYVYGTAKPSAAEEGGDAFFCFDAADGRTLWKQVFPSGTNAASGTPCVAGGRVYGLGTSGMLYCLDANDGKPLWTVRAKGVPSAKWGETMSSSVLALGDRVIAMAGPLTAFRSDTGEILWVQDKVGPSESSPVVWERGGRTFLICNTTRQCYGVNAQDGTVVWSVAGGMFSTPVVQGDRMVLLGGTEKAGLSAYRLTPEKAELLWKAPLWDRGASPVIYGDHVYAVANNKVVCLALADGAVAWEWNEGFKVEISSPIVVGGYLLAFSGGAGLYMFRAAPVKAERLASARLEASVVSCSSPAFTGGKLFLRLSKKGVACYDLRAPGGADGG